MKIEADAHVAEALYRRACGYSHPAVKIFMPAGASEPVYAPYTEHYPPDANAALRWLMNRQPERWRDRRNMEHTGSVDVRLMQMTPDERAADAVALVQRIQARLAAARAARDDRARPLPAVAARAAPQGDPGEARPASTAIGADTAAQTARRAQHGACEEAPTVGGPIEHTVPVGAEEQSK